MSLEGNVNKVAGDFQRFIQRTALRGKTDKGGYMLGTARTVGYVCDINEDGELKGTVNVQEFNIDDGDYEYEGAGFHEGVRLSAIQDNADGVYIIPMLYSEVVITRNPEDGMEYVVMYSHAKRVQVQTREEIKLGVVEVEEPVETDGELEKDFFELEPTGKQAITEYDKDTIRDEVSVDGEGLVETKTAAQKTIEVGNTKIIIDGSNVTIETNGKVSFKVGGSTITEEDGKINIKTTDATVNAKNVKVNGKSVEITGGTLKTKGTSSTDLNGPFNAIKVCPFSGAPHCGSLVKDT